MSRLEDAFQDIGDFLTKSPGEGSESVNKISHRIGVALGMLETEFEEDFLEFTFYDLVLGRLIHKDFYPGAETDRIMPTLACDPRFPAVLIVELFRLAHCLAHELPHDPDTMNTTLPPEANEVADLLSDTMNECRRLKACPDLFPSRRMEKGFLSIVATLSTYLATLRELAEDDDIDGPRSDRDENGNLFGDELEDRNSGGFDNEGIDCGPIYPEFSRIKPGGKHPWNSWLDNSAKAAFSWVSIQQKIPRFGDRLNRRLTERYRVVEKQFKKEGQVVRNPVKEPLEIDLPGESFRHMNWSGFFTMPLHNLGFAAGSRKPFDCNGVVTLENISQVLDLVENKDWRRRPTLRTRNSNCPYFRFAVAYQPLHIPKCE